MALDQLVPEDGEAFGAVGSEDYHCKVGDPGNPVVGFLRPAQIPDDDGGEDERGDSEVDEPDRVYHLRGTLHPPDSGRLALLRKLERANLPLINDNEKPAFLGFLYPVIQFLLALAVRHRSRSSLQIAQVPMKGWCSLNGW